MADPISITAGFPTGGMSKGQGHQGQESNTTALALNVWPQQWPGGRSRGGSRPGVTGTSKDFGIPYNWCRAEWNGGSGVAIVTSTGVWVSTDGLAWSHRVDVDPVGNFASCTVYNLKLYMASSSLTNIHYYNLIADEEGDVDDDTTTGTAPNNCGLIHAFGDRLVLAGDTGNPHLLYMSRIGGHTDWDDAQTDSAAAWTNAGANPGKIGEPITCLFSHNRACLLVGCTGTIYVVRGNPKVGGTPVEILSNEVGPLMQSAICKTGSEHTVFMSRHGLYRMEPGCGTPPIPMSDENLPDDLSDIDPSDSGVKVALTYDARFRGIHIYVNRSGADDNHYFYSLLSSGYWPMDFTDGPMLLGVNLKAASSSTQSGCLALKEDNVYRFDTASVESFDSFCLFGPFALGSPHTEGLLTELSSVLSDDSDDASWEVYAAGSPQEAYTLAETGTAPNFTGQDWTQGLNYSQHPRIRGTVCYIKVFTAGADRWTLEEMFGVAYSRAKRRVR